MLSSWQKIIKCWDIGIENYTIFLPSCWPAWNSIFIILYITEHLLSFTYDTVSAIIKERRKISVRFSVIFSGGLKCCLCGLSYWVIFTKELSDWEKGKVSYKNTQASQERPKPKLKKTALVVFGKANGLPEPKQSDFMLFVKNNFQKSARNIN